MEHGQLQGTIASKELEIDALKQSLGELNGRVEEKETRCKSLEESLSQSQFEKKLLASKQEDLEGVCAEALLGRRRAEFSSLWSHVSQVALSAQSYASAFEEGDEIATCLCAQLQE